MENTLNQNLETPSNELKEAKLNLEKKSLILPSHEAIAKANRDLIFSSTESLSATINAYFRYCNNNNHHPTFNGLALSLGIATSDLKHFPVTNYLYPIITSAKQRIAALIEESLLTSRNSTGAFSWLKNNDGWSDKSEVTHVKPVTASDILKLMQQGGSIDGEVTPTNDFLPPTNTEEQPTLTHSDTTTNPPDGPLN